MAAAFQGGDRGVDSRLPANAGFYFPIGNEKVKPPMRSRGGLSCAGLRLDRLSTDVIGPNEADCAETRIKLLQAGIRAVCRQFAIPGDLDGILSVEDEEHRGILQAETAGFRCLFSRWR